MTETVVFLTTLADEMDAKVRETNKGGWSTHLNDWLTSKANDCRRLAAELKQAYGIR